MKFSILVAHYNNEIYFKDCFESILNQTYQNFEVIIVDDSSNEFSYKEISKIIKDDKRFRIFRNQINKGVGFTKNKCASLATGEIMAFLDPDDSLHSSALELTLKTHHQFPNSSAVYSKMILCDNKLTPIEVFKRTCKISNKDPYFVNLDTSVAHFFTFKKIFYDKIEGINLQLKSAVDQDLYLKLYDVGNFIFLNKELYLYRLHESGVSQSKNKINAKNDFKNVIRETLLRRNILKLGNKLLRDLSNDEIYDYLMKRENTFTYKLKKKINQYLWI